MAEVGYARTVVQVDRDAPVCPACGAAFEPGARFCTSCGRVAGGDTVRVSVPGSPALPTTGERPIGQGGQRPSIGARGTPLFAAFVLVLAALVVAAGLGQWLVSLLLVPVVLTLGVAVASLTWGDIEEPVDRLVQRTAEQLWAAARVTRVSVTNWSRVGRTDAALRARRRRLRSHQERLLRDLGEAVYLGDDQRTATARAAAMSNGAEIEQCTAALAALRAGHARRVQAERDATASTEVFPTPTPAATDTEAVPERR